MDVGQRDARAALGQHLRHREPEPRGSTRDDDARVADVEEPAEHLRRIGHADDSKIPPMREPLFTETLQISVVVRDLEAAMETYVSGLRHRPVGHLRVQPRQRDAACTREVSRSRTAGVSRSHRSGRCSGSSSSRSTATASTRGSWRRTGPASTTSASACASYEGTIAELADAGTKCSWAASTTASTSRTSPPTATSA